ncbi:MAG: N-acetyltransferase family protein [Beijerinckiaceae bacterium]
MNGSGVTIRLLTAADAAAFKAFRLQSLRDAPDAFHSLPEEWDLPLETIVQRIEGNRIFGAFDGAGTFVGIAMLTLTARAIKQMRHKAEIWAVYVDPAARGHGLARRLMERCIAEARALGFEAVVLTASAHLSHVVALYESLDFAIYGTERGMVKLVDGRVIDDHLMELRL